MSDPRLRKLPGKTPAKKRVVEHDRVVTARPALLSPEEEDFNRFLEEQALEDEKKPDPKANS